ncbi:MAG TPA: hypothetical protein VFE14_10570 [Micromonosporaceae bacterium]|nr:hypothetical protein [Micromonosporaceae bacterium]
MKTRRWAIAGLAAVAALALATAACGTKSNDTGKPAPSPTPAAPKDVLAASIKELGKSSYTFTFKASEFAGQGAVDPAAQSARIELHSADPAAEVQAKVEFVLIGAETYVKLDFGNAPIPNLPPKDKFLRVDRSKLKKPDEFAPDLTKQAEVTEVNSVVNSIVSVEKATGATYRGTVDLTKVGNDNILVDEDVVGKLADAAKAVPFEATLDDKGRLIKLAISIPAAGTVKAQTWETTYADFGSVAKVEKPPAAQTIDAPATVYDIFNS